MFKNSNIGGLIRVFPWLKHIIPDYIGYTNMKKVNEAVQELVNESYQKHVETFDSENIRDFTDAYIKQQLGNLFVAKTHISNIIFEIIRIICSVQLKYIRLSQYL